MSTNKSIYGCNPAQPSSVDNKYHYVYRITNIITKKHYYGKRSSMVRPFEDLGTKYFSSSRDKEFMKDQKENPQNYKYKTIRCFSDNKSALLHEIDLHNKFDVGVSVHFYNRAKQTSTYYATDGSASYIDETGNTVLLSTVEAKHRGLSGVTVGYAVYFIENGKTEQVLVEEAKRRGLKCVTDSRVSIIENGVIKTITKEEFDTNSYDGITKGLVMAKFPDGTTEQVKRDDPRLKTGELLYVNQGRRWLHHPEHGGRLCDPDEHERLLQEGWSDGYPKVDVKGKWVIVTNDTEEKHIIKEELEDYLSNGWVRGKVKNKLSIFHRDRGRGWCTAYELQEYLNRGWVIKKGRDVYVSHKEFGMKEILKEDLQMYLDDGWLKGQVKFV